MKSLKNVTNKTKFNTCNWKPVTKSLIERNKLDIIYVCILWMK